MVQKGVVLALFAGLLAATASVLGKLATHPSVSQFAQDHFASYPQVVLLFRGALMITTVFINVVMLNWFVKAMDLTNSVFAAVANTASNIFCSAILGWLCFGEVLTMRWWFGAACIVVGLTMMHKGLASH